MRKVKIITDSCADLGVDLLEKYDIAYGKMNVVIKGEEKPACLDWSHIPAHDFFELMRDGERLTTTQVPAPVFTEMFADYMENGYDIVYIACSNTLSGSINISRIVAKELTQKYPEAKIFCIDTLTSGMGEGLLAVYAAKLRDAGKNAAEIAEEIEGIKLCANAFMTVASLENFRQQGRVSADEAYNKIMFGAKPILICDANGRIVPIKKVMGRRASLDELVDQTKAVMTDPENNVVYIAHGDCPADADYVAEKIRELVCPAEVYINTFGPITGLSTGPDSIGIFVMGKEVTYAV